MIALYAAYVADVQLTFVQRESKPIRVLFTGNFQMGAQLNHTNHITKLTRLVCRQQRHTDAFARFALALSPSLSLHPP